MNLIVVVLSFWYAWRCYKDHMKKKEDKENMVKKAMQHNKDVTLSLSSLSPTSEFNLFQ
jgi:Tfp pilus assembly protein PilO